MNETPLGPDPTRAPWPTFALVGSAVVVGALNFSVMFIAFAEIEETFAADPATLSWALTGYSITIAAVLIPGGWLADRLGRRTVFLSGVALFTLGSLLVAVAPTVELLVGARVIQAAGVGLESPAGLAIVLHAFPSTRRSTAVGAFGGLGGISAAFGPVVGGALIEAFGWRWTFAASVPIGLVTMALVITLLPDTDERRATGRPDLVGVVMLMIGVSALALGVVQSAEWGWSDWATIGSIGAAALLLGLVVTRSSRHPAPIIDLELFAERRYRQGNVLTFALAGNFAGTYLCFVVLLTEIWGLSVFRAGLALALIPTIGGPLSFVAGRLADRYGHRAVIAPGAACMAGGATWVLLAVGAETEIVRLWLPAVGLYSIGVGLGHAASSALAMTRVPADRLGLGGATNRIFQEIGSVIAVAVVVVLLAGGGGVSLAGVRRVMVLLIVTSVSSFVTAAAVRPPGRMA